MTLINTCGGPLCHVQKMLKISVKNIVIYSAELDKKQHDATIKVIPPDLIETPPCAYPTSMS
jgi:hypothetical protein